MITSIEIENFKGFGSQSQILKLAPITLLFGANSVGKTSIFHALFFMREIFETSRATPGEMTYFSPQVELGGFKNVVHAHDTERKIRFKLSLDTERMSDEEYSMGGTEMTLEVELAQVDRYRAFVEKFSFCLNQKKIVECTAKWNSEHRWMDISVRFYFSNFDECSWIDPPVDLESPWTTIYRFSGAVPMPQDPMLSMCSKGCSSTARRKNTMLRGCTSLPSDSCR